MQKLTAYLFITLICSVVIGRAEDQIPSEKPVFRRLEFIHFDSVARTVEWGVSAGSFDDSGEYVPGALANRTFKIDLENGVMSHDGEEDVLGSKDAKSASKIFDLMGMMMQAYTDELDYINSPEIRNQRFKLRASQPLQRNLASFSNTTQESKLPEEHVPDTLQVKYHENISSQNSSPTTSLHNPINTDEVVGSTTGKPSLAIVR